MVAKADSHKSKNANALYAIHCDELYSRVK